MIFYTEINFLFCLCKFAGAEMEGFLLVSPCLLLLSFSLRVAPRLRSLRGRNHRDGGVSSVFPKPSASLLFFAGCAASALVAREEPQGRRGFFWSPPCLLLLFFSLCCSPHLRSLRGRNHRDGGAPKTLARKRGRAPSFPEVPPSRSLFLTLPPPRPLLPRGKGGGFFLFLAQGTGS